MTASELKKSILQMAVEGKLTKQSEKDEPVEKLLKRIKEEKDNLIKEGKIKKEKTISEIYKKDGSYYERIAEGKNILKEVCIDEELPFEIPDSWAWVRLGNIFNIISSRRVHQSDWKKSGIPFYRAREIAKLSEYGYVDNELFIDKSLYESFTKYNIPKKNDLMVTAVGTLGKTYIVKETDKFYYKDASVLCFENFSKINPNYLKILMDSNFMFNQIKINSSGTTVDTITIIRAKEYIIPLPPIEEQGRIVEKINLLMPLINEYDSLEKSITKLNKEFPDNIKKSILQYAIEGKLTEQSQEDEPAEELLKRIKKEREKLIKEGKIKKDKTTSEIYKKDGSYYERITDGKNILKDVCIDDELPFEIPDSWVWVRLGKLVYLISGTSYNKNDITDRGIRILRGGNIQNNQLLLFDDDVFLPASYYDEEKNIKKYDIIIVASTGSKTVIGKPAFIEDDYNNTQIGAFLRIIRLYDIKISSYINTIFESNYYREHIRNKVTGTNINNIKSDYVENLLIPLPPIEEQKRIVDKINRVNEVINTIKI